MDTIEDLFRFILRHDHVVVFGNLGRYPQKVFNALSLDPQLNVAIQSAYYDCPSSPDGRIRVITPNQGLDTFCDLMVVLEPLPDQILEKPPKASRLVVFTSHFNCSRNLETVWTLVSFFHCESPPLLIRHTQELLKLQDKSIQTQDIQRVQPNAVNSLTIQGKTQQTLASESYVLIDLTRYTQPLTMYLAFWDAFDYMLQNKSLVQRWCIAFPQSRGMMAFEQVWQNCLDLLYCKTIENGNVTELRNILGLLPFYKSGSIDKEFNVPTASFMGVEYLALSKPEDVCKAASKHNLEYWVGSIYRLK